MISVPVLQGFDQEKVIGLLEIDPAALPPTPEFVFSLGYLALDPSNSRTGPYQLMSVSPVSDLNFIGLMQQRGRIPAVEEVDKPVGWWVMLVPIALVVGFIVGQLSVTQAGW